MDLKEIIVGNVCSLCAMVSDSVSGTRKKNSHMLAVQILSQLFYGSGSVILKGYSSAAQNVVGILRNLAAMKKIDNKTLKLVVEWALIALGVVLGAAFNNRGLLGWLPIVANLEYSVCVFRFRENEKGLKTAFVINMVMYAVFSFIILNYVGAAANIVVAVTTAISLIRGVKNKNTQSPANEESAETPSC